MTQLPESSSSLGAATGTRLPAAEALRVAAQLTDRDEDLHAITRMVLALVGADDRLTGAAADDALARAGVPADARRLLVAAVGPPADRPSVAELRAGLDAALAGGSKTPAPPRTGMARLLDELRGRRVTRTALWYAGASVAIVEAANVFVPMLGGPTEIVRLLAIAAVCGLPIALALSWTFDVRAADTGRRARWPRFALLGSVTVLSVAAAALTWKNSSPDDASASGSATSAPPDPAHVAVVGFNTVGGDDDLAAFAAQLQVRLIDGLSAVASGAGVPRDRQLRVLSHAGVLPFIRGSFVVDSLRTARSVGTMLDGTVERTTDGVRVRVRLVDTQTGDQIHTSSAHVSSNDRIALLDALADSVLRLVRTRLGVVVRDRMRLLETRDTAAFDRLAWAAHRVKEFDPAFGRADYEAAERVLNDADSAFAAAERLDPRWIEPILERGRLSRHRARLARARADTSAIMPAILAGIAHAERALVLRPNDPRALQLRGEQRHYQLQVAHPADPAETDRVRGAAEHDLQASLIGNHWPAKPLRLLSELAGGSGRMHEALQYGERAHTADPYMEEVHFTVFRLYEYSFALHEDADAARWCGEGRRRYAVPMFPAFVDCRLALGAWSDKYPLTPDSAWLLVAAELNESHAPDRPNLEPRLHAMAAAVLVRSGMRDSARVLLRNARRRDDSDGLLRAAAGVHGLLGERDSALVTLQTLLQRTPAARRTLQNAVELRTVANDPRIRALLDAAPPRGR